MQKIEFFGKRERYVFNWLISGCLLIVLMIAVGGITRLTQSGLSMVKWDPIMGTLPPMSQSAWEEIFALYKESPEFIHKNAQFVLSDFKAIFFWEYLHRLLARILGLLFIVPFFIFWFKGFFNSWIKNRVIIILILGASQGLLGWFMVKSGLVDHPHVSHFRLAAHLITALGLMMYIYWTALSLKYVVKAKVNVNYTRLVKGFIVLVFLQIIYGAFVAGLNGGLHYITFPKMGNEWIPTDFGNIISREGISAVFDKPGIVQFQHRIIAYLIVIGLAILWIKSKKVNLDNYQRIGISILTMSILIQILLGILTLINAVPVALGVLHQFGAVLVLTSSFYFLFTLKINKHANI